MSRPPMAGALPAGSDVVPDGSRLQMVVRGLVALAAIAGLALTAGPAYAQSPVSGGASHGLAAPIRVPDSAAVGQSSSHHKRFTFVCGRI